MEKNIQTKQKYFDSKNIGLQGEAIWKKPRIQSRIDRLGWALLNLVST